MSVVLIVVGVLFGGGFWAGWAVGRRAGIREAAAVPGRDAPWHPATPPHPAATPSGTEPPPGAALPLSPASTYFPRPAPGVPPAAGVAHRPPPHPAPPPPGARIPAPAPARRPATPVERAAQERRAVNITFAASTLLLVAAAGLFIGTFLPPVARLGGLALVAGGLMSAGLVVHARSRRLQPAALTLVGAGLALVPLLGVLLDVAVLHRPTLSWLVTSAVGVLLGVLLAVRLRSMVVAHLAATFVASSALASGAALRSGLVWTLAAGLLLSIALCWLLERRPIPADGRGMLVTALRRQHAWLGYGLGALGVGLTLATGGQALSSLELAVVAALTAGYAGSRLLTLRPPRWWDGTSARVAALVALTALAHAIGADAHAAVLTGGATAAALAAHALLRPTPGHPAPRAEAAGLAALAWLAAALEPSASRGAADGILAVALVLLTTGLAVARRRSAWAPWLGVLGPIAAAGALAPAAGESRMWAPVVTLAAAALVVTVAWTAARSALWTLAGLQGATGMALVAVVAWATAVPGPPPVDTVVTGAAVVAVAGAWAVRLPPVLRDAKADARLSSWGRTLTWLLWSTVAVALAVSRPAGAALPGDAVTVHAGVMAVGALGLVTACSGGLLLLRDARPDVPGTPAVAFGGALVLTAVIGTWGSAGTGWAAGSLSLALWAAAWIALAAAAPRAGLSRWATAAALFGAQLVLAVAAARLTDGLGLDPGVATAVAAAVLLGGAALRGRVLETGHPAGRAALWGTGVVLLLLAAQAWFDAHDRFGVLAAGLAVAGVGLLHRRPRRGPLVALAPVWLTAGGLTALLALTDVGGADAGLIPRGLVPAAVAAVLLAVAGAAMGLLRTRPGVLALAPAGAVLLAAAAFSEVAAGRLGAGGTAALVTALPGLGAAVLVALSAARRGVPQAGPAVAPLAVVGAVRGALATVAHTGPATGAAVLVGATLACLAVVGAAVLVGRIPTGGARGRRTLSSGTVPGSAVLVRPLLQGAAGSAAAVGLTVLLAVPAEPAWTLAAAGLAWTGAAALVTLSPVPPSWSRILRIHLLTLAGVLAAVVVRRWVGPEGAVETASLLWWTTVALAVIVGVTAGLDRLRATRYASAGLHTLAALAVPGVGGILLPSLGAVQLTALAGFALLLGAGVLVRDRVLLWWGAAGLTACVMYALSALFFLWLVLIAAALFALGVRQLLRADRAAGPEAVREPGPHGR